MNIIIQPFHDFKKWIDEGFRTRDAHLFKSFEKNDVIEKIIIINRPVSLAEIVLKRKPWKTKSSEMINVYDDGKLSIQKMNKKVYIIDLKSNDFFKVLFLKRKWWFHAFRNKKNLDKVKFALDFLEVKYFNLLLQNPMAIGLNDLNPNNFIFDAIDNWLEHPQMRNDKRLLINNYDYINNKADFLISVSRNNFKLFPKINFKFEIPNGVDLDFFNIETYKVNRNNKNVVYGYVGKIQERFDFDLLESCLQYFQEDSFKIYGPFLDSQSKRKAKLLKSKYPNLYFEGEVKYDKLPNILNAIDIAILPHQLNEFTKSMSPLKLYEYLAAGKQIVTTDVNGELNLSRYIYVAKDSKDFISKCVMAKEILVQNNYQFEEKVLLSLESDISWDSRAKKIIEVIR